jgi:hypothetical protein
MPDANTRPRPSQADRYVASASDDVDPELAHLCLRKEQMRSSQTSVQFNELVVELAFDAFATKGIDRPLQHH